MNQSLPTAADGLPQGRFSGRQAFAALLLQALQTAAAQGWREMIFCDPTFEDWPLGERPVAVALHEWSRSGRQMTLLAHDYQELQRRHARFVTWRKTWAHIILCRRNTVVPEDSLPSALWSPHWMLERLERVHSTGLSSAAPALRLALRERLNECLRTSTPGFAAYTLGL
jgi:hypothetical protein